MYHAQALANSLCARLAIGPPSRLLSRRHNNDVGVNRSWWWGRYFAWDLVKEMESIDWHGEPATPCNRSAAMGSRDGGGGGTYCYDCGGTGHMSRECPKKQRRPHVNRLVEKRKGEAQEFGAQRRKKLGRRGVVDPLAELREVAGATTIHYLAALCGCWSDLLTWQALALHRRLPRAKTVERHQCGLSWRRLVLSS